MYFSTTLFLKSKLYDYCFWDNNKLQKKNLTLLLNLECITKNV